MGTTSYSETSAYVLCRRKHFYGYGMGIERNDTSDSLGMGKALHSALEAYYRAFLGTAWTPLLHVAAVREAVSVYDAAMPDPVDNRQDLHDSLLLYFTDEPFVSQGWTVLGVEAEFVVEYDEHEQGRYPFVVDLIVKDPWGQVAVVDHKSGYDFLGDGNAEHLQPQLALYIGGMRALGRQADYGIYNMFRTRKIKAPTRDQLLKVSPVYPTPTRVRTTFEEQVGLAREVEARKVQPIADQSKTAYRTANKMVCQSCAFAELCISDLMGSNSALVLATQFHPRVRREFMTVTEEV